MKGHSSRWEFSIEVGQSRQELLIERRWGWAWQIRYALTEPFWRQFIASRRIRGDGDAKPYPFRGRNSVV